MRYIVIYGLPASTILSHIISQYFPTLSHNTFPHYLTIISHIVSQYFPTLSHNTFPHYLTIRSHIISQYFPTLSHNICPHYLTIRSHIISQTPRFPGKKLKIKKRVSRFSLQMMSETFLIIRRNERDMTKMCVGLHVK